jgi:sorbitol-specific phosphotransferase system component IIC
MVAGLANEDEADKARTQHGDTVAIDTSMRFNRPQPTELAQTEQANLRKLTIINVDRPLFNKLYKNAKVSRLTYAKQETNVDDKNSVFKHKVNGLYININYSDSEYLLNFGCQYAGKKALDLQSVTFIIDNKHLHYKPVFLGGTIEGQAMVYSYEMIHDGDIPMLLSLATADKAIIHFKGKNGNDQMTLSKDQQDVLKRQLQLYKGLLLGYAKQ